MRLISFALLTALAATVAYAGPTQEDVAAARLAYIDGDYDAALKVIQEGAEAGNAMALNILGAASLDGRGVPQDTNKAIEFFERAEKAGEVRGYFNLGTLFIEGSPPVEPDRARATRELQSTADQGYAPAMTALGRLQETAEPPNHEAAADWYEKGHKRVMWWAQRTLHMLTFRASGATKIGSKRACSTPRQQRVDICVHSMT